MFVLCSPALPGRFIELHGGAALRCMMSDRYRSSTRGITRFEFW
jgi:hypothetical protein